ncbi:leucine-rich repeat-containing protein 73 isoform X1 [Hydra vulgaris]|uniref:Uncharacterized protein C6orf154 n=1 Tax=Hydra vulgaris TaxID=6087 RepID=T2MC18_HYDVU|nr:leucine-rich repeat-containing protein 73 [Hydra vulgaris]
MLGSVQILGEDVGDIDVRDMCDSLRANSIRLLSLRGCRMKDYNFKKLMESLKVNSSLAHLNLNLGLISTKERALCLADGLKGNTSINTLTLHGNPLGDEGLTILVNAIENHHQLQTLDVGDCQLGDQAVSSLCSLLKYKSNEINLLELTLTGNRRVTQIGWASLAMAIAHGSRLQKLYLDYNDIGDFGAGLFAVALSSSPYLKYIDFEGCEISDAGAEMLCDSLECHNNTLLELNLQGNKIKEEILNEIKECLLENNNAKKFK